MKDRLGTESTAGSSDLAAAGGAGGGDVLLHHQNKALSADNSLSSGPGDVLDGSASVTAASSPATLPFRLVQQQQHLQHGFLEVEVEGGRYSCCSSSQSQGASRASTLSLKKKKVNIMQKGGGGGDRNMIKKDIDNDSDLDLEAAHETTALNHPHHGYSDSAESRTTTPADNYLTMSGTITRGKRAGQQTDVKVNISREELELIESTHAKMKAELEVSSRVPEGNPHGSPPPSRACCCCCRCGCKRGLHVWVWSVLSFPVVFLLASVYSFYMGTLTWYNIFSWYTEEKPFLCRVLMAPLLIVSYPLLILLSTVGLGGYAAVNQLTCNWFTWRSSVQDLEKGFYAWLCSLLKLEECSPYTEVVIVGQLDSLASPTTTTAHE